MEHVHFIGIGGAGMSALAQVLLARGVRVSGSDPQQNAATERLKRGGAIVYPAQSAENIEGRSPDLVVVSAAIGDDNPELVAAKEARLPIVSRAEFLGKLMAEFGGPRVAVSGTHGKTTTTAMIAEVLMAGGMDPTALIGGEYAGIGGNVRVGQSGVFLTEACEAYDSFLALFPDIAVITNIEADHLDYYENEARLFESFRRFAEQTAAGGALVWCGEDAGARHLVEGLPSEAGPRRRVEYGFAAPTAVGVWATDVVLEGVGAAFVVHQRDESGEGALGSVRLSVPGRHNVLNALAAVAVGLETGVPFATIEEGLERFQGAGRRLERLGEAREILVVDDYAHHPTEIRATLAAVRAAYPQRRVVTVFQPHLYSRTRDFLNEFADALSESDVILLTDIYPARERPIPGVRVVDIVHRIARLAPDKTLLYLPDKRDVVGALAWVTQPGDLVLTMGAGDINEAAQAFLSAMRAHA